ncbi:MAG: alpha-L-fucosidase [Pseudomonadales bacterium]
MNKTAIKAAACIVLAAISTWCTAVSDVAQQKNADPAYEANWESLKKHEVPQWAKDAKFGVYAHWGAYSVSGQWDYSYPNWGNAYITPYRGIYHHSANNEARKLFEKNIGPVDQGYGYKDLAKQFTADNFDPQAWADLVAKSGARYAGIAAIHHDGYALWDSDITDFSAGKLGAERDLFGELLSAFEQRGLKTIASFHHARTYKHYQGLIEKLRDNPDRKNVDLLDPKNENYYWFAGDKASFTKTRYDLTKEVIDKYKPDVLWFDGGGGKYGTERILADFFNMADTEGKQVSVHNKGNFPEQFGVYSYENGHARPLYVNWPWEDDTPSATGWCDWPWFKAIEYKKPRDIIVRLADLVARNGGLLLSMNPRPDGTLDQGQENLLLGIGTWLRQNGDAIYDTVPWKIFAEGHTERLEYFETNHDGKKSRAIQPDPNQLNWQDVRFTRNGENLYAIVLGVPPSGSVSVKSLSLKTSVSDINKIQSVELLGHGAVIWTRDSQSLHIVLPDKLPNDWALSFHIRVDGELDKAEPVITSTKMKMPKQT